MALELDVNDGKSTSGHIPQLPAYLMESLAVLATSRGGYPSDISPRLPQYAYPNTPTSTRERLWYLRYLDLDNLLAWFSMHV